MSMTLEQGEALIAYIDASINGLELHVHYLRSSGSDVAMEAARAGEQHRAAALKSLKELLP